MNSAPSTNMPATTMVAFPATIVGERASQEGTIGDAERASMRMNAATTAIAARPGPKVRQLAQPRAAPG